MFDPRRVLRWIYIGRLSLAAAIFVAALVQWRRADSADTLIATLAVLGAILFTFWSLWSTGNGAPVSRTFCYEQALFDVALVTVVVHVTGGALSLFAPLYILVTVGASLLLPVGGVLLIAALGNAAYFADVLLGHRTPVSLALILQLVVFALVALAVAYLAARLQEAGVNREELEARLNIAKLQAEDILKNIRSGIVTIDARGRMLFANPMSGTLLGFDSESVRGRPVREVFASTAPALVAALERAVQARERVTRGEAAITVHGRTFPIGLTTTTIDADGTPEGISATAIFQDISDNKRLEELRLRAERLEAVAELSASLAHEIKNPLASIRSATEQLARRTKAERRRAHARPPHRARVRPPLAPALGIPRFRPRARHARRARGHDRHRAHRRRPRHRAPRSQERRERALHRAHRPALRRGRRGPAAPRGVQHRAQRGAGVARERRGEDRDRHHGRGPDPHRRPLHRCTPSRCASATTARAFRWRSATASSIPSSPRSPAAADSGLPIVHRAIEAHRGFVFLDSSNKGTRFTVLLPLARPPVSPELT